MHNPCSAGLGKLAVLALTATYILTQPCAAETSAKTAKSSLTPPYAKHAAKCDSPQNDLCVIKKPVGTGYRLLTPDIVLEDVNDHWLVDFTKTKLTGNRMTFRVMGSEQDIHEIQITFTNVHMPATKSQIPTTTEQAPPAKAEPPAAPIKPGTTNVPALK